jgi:hypothetical protein
MLFLDLLRHLYIILFFLVLFFLVSGCNWPYLAVAKHMNKRTNRTSACFQQFCVYPYILFINLVITLIRSINGTFCHCVRAYISVMYINLGELNILPPFPVFRSLCHFC